MKRVDDIFNSLMIQQATTYTLYDYLESDSRGQCIDTGIAPNNNTRVICEYFFRPGVSRAFVFAARNENGVAQYIQRGIYLGNAGANYGNGFLVFGQATANTRYTVDANKNVWTLTKEQQQPIVITFSEQTFVTNCTLTLFAMNEGGNYRNYRDPSAIISAKIYDNGVLVRDFHPAVRDTDGVAGMLDVVNDTFYSNAAPNQDNFLYGNLT